MVGKPGLARKQLAYPLRWATPSRIVPWGVVGVHDRTGTGPLEPDYDRAFAGVPTDDFILALAHQPTQAFAMADRGVNLQLAGHTHGGQLWPFGYFVRADQPTLSGLDEVAGVPIYTSRGAGAWGPPVRVAAPPEIAVIDITPAGL